MLARPIRPLLCLGLFFLTATSFAQDAPSQLDELEAAKKKLAAQQEYRLRYKFAAGETLRWKVVHVASTDTKIQGNTQTSQSRSASIKTWKVVSVDDQGVATVTHSVDKIDMWHKLSDRPEVRYNSETTKTPPPGYEKVANTVGVPLSTYRISPTGEILSRESEHAQMKFGVGDVTAPLPEEPISLGHQWSAPHEVRVRTPDGRVLPVKCRQVYLFKGVNNGLAEIDVNTEILTPIADPSAKAQLIQQMTQGQLLFDIEHGKLLSKQFEWDETVISFSGADSLMHYLARFTEQFIVSGQDSRQANSDEEAAAEVAETIIRDRVGDPTIRR